MNTPLPALFALLASAGVVSTAAFADAQVTLNDRAHLLALDERCALLDTPAREALDAGRLQARGALARAGVEAADLDATEEAAAASADAVACDSPATVALAADAANAFEAWRSLQSMDFPARRRGWRAARADRYETAWLVRQDIPWGSDGRAIFGLVATAPKPALALYVDGGRRSAQAARVLLRNTGETAEPIDRSLVRLLAGPNVDELTLNATPDALTTAHWASRRSSGAEAATFAGDTAANAPAIFLFPAHTLESFEELGPRETVAAEFDISAADGSLTTERILIEAGDFRAARVFAQPSPADPPATESAEP